MTGTAQGYVNSGSVRVRADSERHDRTHLDLDVDGSVVARLTIDRYALYLDSGKTVAMDGIGNVFTDEEHRGKGYARTLMLAAIKHMRCGDAAISMLYGIDDFYDRLGWVRAGDEHWLQLRIDPRSGRDQQGAELPEGWTARAFARHDTEAIRAIYESTAAETVGAAVRGSDAPAWLSLTDVVQPGGSMPPDGIDMCRVIVDASASVVAYALHGAPFGVSNDEARRSPTAFVLSELQGLDAEAADVALTMVKAWAVEASSGTESVRVPCAPGSPLATAAVGHQHNVERRVRPAGGSMVLLLDETLWRSAVVDTALDSDPPAWSSELVGEAMLAADQFMFIPDRY